VAISADLRGKRLLITGAASGIGLATAELFAACGARVAINDLARNEALAREVARLRSAGRDVLAAPGDVGDAMDAARLVEAAVRELGGLDFLVNNAATPGTREAIAPADLERLDEPFWARLLSVNLVGPFRCIRAAAPHLKAARGAIVNVASTAAFGAGGSSMAYGATKAALVLLTRELAKGLGPQVRVNAIAPGWVGGTNWDCRWTPDEAATAAQRLPLGRVGEPADFAEPILYLCAGAGYVTGQTLVVDGGLLA
jgi:3-oxoacyl-[acyl-carrier protein] reductase